MEEDVTMAEANRLMEVMEASCAKRAIQSFLSFTKGKTSSRPLSQSLKSTDSKARNFSKKDYLARKLHITIHNTQESTTCSICWEIVKHTKQGKA
jgi:hypothetical protein